MCEIIDSETYLKCSHTFPCHLKYALKYCRAPNGVPFPHPRDARVMYPNRYCPIEEWNRLTLGFDLRCKNCEMERRKKRREREEKGEEERGLLEVDSGEDTEDEKENRKKYEGLGVSIEEEDEAAPAGVVTLFQGCGCQSVVYRASKLQGCFEKKPALTQMMEKARRAAGSAEKHFGSAARRGASVKRGYYTYRSPTPPTADKPLLRAHKAAEAEEFSVKKRDMLICRRKVSEDRCGECERKWVLARWGKEGDRFEGYGFRSKKPMGLSVIPALDGNMEDVKGVRGEY